MPDPLAERFQTTFNRQARLENHARELKNAALSERLRLWTREMTSVSVKTCIEMNWKASAKSHALELLPIKRSEYLGLDVIAFPDGPKRWRFPSAVIELENSKKDNQIAYSLWKVLSVRANLRAVFCYRPSKDQAPPLVKHLREEVVDAMGLAGRSRLEGDTFVVIGNRDESETFPYGYFHWWQLNTNTGRFERF